MVLLGLIGLLAPLALCAAQALAASTATTAALVAGAASAAMGTGQTIDLFYGAALLPEAWYTKDRAAFSAAVGSGTLTLTEAYNEWLAIADLRAAVYAAAAHQEPDGIVVYAPGPSAVLHALGLALQAREDALVWLLGTTAAGPVYPAFAELGYRDGNQFIDKPGTRQPDAETPDEIGGLIAELPLPPGLFAGDQIMLMPYHFTQEFGVTAVSGPDIRTWLGADAQAYLKHVLFHELAHTVHFRFGGFDSTANGQALSPFWEEYLTLRGLTWQDPTQAPWTAQTPECFAEDFAHIFVLSADPLGYQTTGCTPPTGSQVEALLGFYRGLVATTASPSPFRQAQWCDWLLPWPSAAFGQFEAMDFIPAGTVTVSLSLDPLATGGPYTLEVHDAPAPLATLQPGGTWTGAVPIGPDGAVQIDADSPTLTLSSLRVYANAAFVPVPRVSGVFRDTLDNWSRPAVAAGVRAGVIGGYPDGTFRPSGPVSRAEFARMVSTALTPLLFSTQGPAPQFSDVHQNQWFAPFVAAVGAELPGVTPSGPFLPNLPLEREEAIAWIARSFHFQALAADQAQQVLAQYPDGQSVGRAYAPWVAAASNAGLVQGDAATGALRPTDVLSRAEAVVLVMRALALSGYPGGAD